MYSPLRIRVLVGTLLICLHAVTLNAVPLEYYVVTEDQSHTIWSDPIHVNPDGSFAIGSTQQSDFDTWGLIGWSVSGNIDPTVNLSIAVQNLLAVSQNFTFGRCPGSERGWREPDLCGWFPDLRGTN
jgi:hypothetical protein